VDLAQNYYRMGGVRNSCKMHSWIGKGNLHYGRDSVDSMCWPPKR